MPNKKGKRQKDFRVFLSSRLRTEGIAATIVSSPRFSYAMCKKLDGRVSQPGTTAWWGVRVAKGYGVCEERLCPYDTSSSELDFVNFPITKEMLENAYQYRTPAYQRLLSVNDIKKVLAVNKQLATLSFNIFKGIYGAPEGQVPLPEANEKSEGVHCVIICGYDDKRQVIKFQNSWGVEWGDKGFGHIPYSYLEKYTVECWATMLRQDWENIKQNLLRTSFKDRKGNSINVQVNKVPSVVYGRSPLWVLDLYGPDGMINGWSHFSIVDYGNVIEVEDIFILPQYRNLGLGAKIMEIMQNAAKTYRIPEIRGWVSAQDLVEDRESMIRSYFTKSGFEIIPDNTKFRGSFWRVQKPVFSNVYFIATDKKAPPIRVDDSLNEIVARSPLRITPEGNKLL